jgi:hypothetical protein
MRKRAFVVGFVGATFVGPVGADSAPKFPTPVACVSAAACDRDPDRLAAYVSGFYEWTVADRAEIFKTYPNDKGPATQAKRDQAWGAHDKLIRSALGPRLAKLYAAQASANDGENSAPQCRDHDADVTTCIVDFPDAWLGPVKSSVEPGDGKGVTLKVTLPKFQFGESPSDQVKEMDGKVLAVTLVADKGVWKIDKVTDIGVKP